MDDEQHVDFQERRKARGGYLPGQTLKVAAFVVFAAAPLAAHHSLAAEFDTSKAVVLHGKVTRVDWMNPHVFLWIDAADSSGHIVNWKVESVAPNYLQRVGWMKQTVKVGDTITIRAFRAKDDPTMAKSDQVTLPDGRVITTGRAEDEAKFGGTK